MNALEISSMTESPEKDFERWWYDEGSGMPLLPLEDVEEHTYRVAKIAWLNSFDKATHK